MIFTYHTIQLLPFLLKIMYVFSKVILLHYGYKKTCFLKTLLEIQNLSISFILKKIDPLTGEDDEKLLSLLLEAKT
jgi:hypothetical protein